MLGHMVNLVFLRIQFLFFSFHSSVFSHFLEKKRILKKSVMMKIFYMSAHMSKLIDLNTRKNKLYFIFIIYAGSCYVSLASL